MPWELGSGMLHERRSYSVIDLLYPDNQVYLCGGGSYRDLAS